MIDFLIGFCCGLTISVVAIYFSLPPNKQAISIIATPDMGGAGGSGSQTFTVPPDVKTITITVGPMTGGGGHVIDETPAQIPDNRP